MRYTRLKLWCLHNMPPKRWLSFSTQTHTNTDRKRTNSLFYPRNVSSLKFKKRKENRFGAVPSARMLYSVNSLNFIVEADTSIQFFLLSNILSHRVTVSSIRHCTCEISNRKEQQQQFIDNHIVPFAEVDIWTRKVQNWFYRTMK